MHVRRRELSHGFVVCMTKAAWGWVWFLAICNFSQKVCADSDYYQAISSAERAASVGDLELAESALQTALRKYPRDFELTLKLGLIQFQRSEYAEAQQSYLLASALSDGSLDARLGLGWSLIELEQCPAGMQVLKSVLDEEPHAYGYAASRGIETCLDRARLHGSVWLGLGGSLYQGHVWKKASGDGVVGLNLQPGRTVLVGAAYHFLALATADHRVPGLNQHELYLQGGYNAANVSAMAHGALIWGGDAIVAGSLHGGLSLHVRYLEAALEEVVTDVTASHYQDLWVGRLSVAVRLAFGQFRVTPGIAIEQFAHRTMAAASTTGEVLWGTVSLWVSGKYGEEYRAAYLSQFAIFNSDEYSRWSMGAGVRFRQDQHWTWFAQYALIGTRSADGLNSALHILSVGSIYEL
jgi:tetratricopeptide (TPR) repeat protein